jgi:TolB protein
VRGSAPAWSPDGKRIAFKEPDAGNPPGCGGISIANVRTGRVRQVVSSRFVEGRGCEGTPYDGADWSPDGRRLVYSALAGRPAANWEGSFELYSIRSDGTGRRRLTDNDALDGWAEWSPDGRFIAFTRERRPGGIGDLWIMRADGSRERHVLHDATGAYWQPLPGR